MLKKLLLTLLLIFSFNSLAFAGDWHELPDGICAKYAAQEFEQIAPSPGVNWLNKNSFWVEQAHEAGWVTKADVHDAMEGAIVEWEGLNQDEGHVAIVRKILADRIIVEEQNSGNPVGIKSYTFGGRQHKSTVTEGWGKTTQRAIPYSALINMDTKKFMGYIWPVRQADYDKNPSQYAISLTSQAEIQEPRYKGFKEYWFITYVLKEFDKIAPAPGVNWHGATETWITSAQKNGWATTTDPMSPQLGALMIRINPTTKNAKVGIVRAIKNNTITIDSRKTSLYPISQSFVLNELSAPDKDGFIFLGYILPTRS